MRNRKFKVLILLMALSTVSSNFPIQAIAASVKVGASCLKIGQTATVSGKNLKCVKKGNKIVWDFDSTTTQTTEVLKFPNGFQQMGKGSRFAYQLSDYTGVDAGHCKTSRIACTVVNIYSIDSCNKFMSEIVWQDANTNTVIDRATIYAFIPQPNFTGKFEFDATTPKILAANIIETVSNPAICLDSNQTPANKTPAQPSNQSGQSIEQIQSICWWVGNPYNANYDVNQKPEGCVKDNEPILINYCSGDTEGNGTTVNAWQYVPLSIPTFGLSDVIVAQQFIRPITQDGFAGIVSISDNHHGTAHDSFSDTTLPAIGTDSFSHSYYAYDIYWRSQGFREIKSQKCNSNLQLISIVLPNNLLNEKQTVRLVKYPTSNPFDESLSRLISWRLTNRKSAVDEVGIVNSADYILNWQGAAWTRALFIHLRSVIRSCTSQNSCTYKVL
jgi:hypothetical protein